MRMSATGAMPKALDLGCGVTSTSRCMRWRTQDIDQWIEAGCPDLSAKDKEQSNDPGHD